MSDPTLHLWQGFLLKLCRELGEATPTSSYRLPVLAERAVQRLHAQPLVTRRLLIRSCLLQEKIEWYDCPIPEQTKALADSYWPLVISTNYDDLYLRACSSRAELKKEQGRPSSTKIRGRSRRDCHQVLRSLDENSPPLFWAIQGFVGDSDLPVEEQNALLGQVVIGHQHYVRATNAEPHFRRAFAEVFRRRSLLFLGSSVNEDYFLQLFSEIVHHHGLGAMPHFALVHQDDDQIDPWFLQTRLGITLIRFEDYQDLPGLLRQFKKAADWRNLPGRERAQFDQCGLTELAYRVVRRPNSPCTVRFVYGELPPPEAREACVVSVGRSASNVPLVGRLAESHLWAAAEKKLLSAPVLWSWHALEPTPSYTFVHGECDRIFAVAARLKSSRTRAAEEEEGHFDRRDLRIVPEAVCETLTCIAGRGFRRIRLGAVASGKRSGLHPVHTFSQTVEGIQRFLKESNETEEIVFHLVDPRVWSLLAAGKIPLAQMLSSDSFEYRIEILGAGGEVESLRISHEGSPSVGDLLESARLQAADWQIFLEPDPTGRPRSQEASLDEVVPNSVHLVLKPKTGAGLPAVFA